MPVFNRAQLAQISPEDHPPTIANIHRPSLEPLYPLRLYTGSFPIAPIPPSKLVPHPPPHWPEDRAELADPPEWAEDWTDRGKFKQQYEPKRRATDLYDENGNRIRRKRRNFPRPPRRPVIVPKCAPDKKRAVLFSEASSPIYPPDYVHPPPKKPRDPNKKVYRPRRSHAEMSRIKAAKQARMDAKRARNEAKALRRLKRANKKLGLDEFGNRLVIEKRARESKATSHGARFRPTSGWASDETFGGPKYGTYREVQDMKKAIAEAMGRNWDEDDRPKEEEEQEGLVDPMDLMPPAGVTGWLLAQSSMMFM